MLSNCLPFMPNIPFEIYDPVSYGDPHFVHKYDREIQTTSSTRKSTNCKEIIFIFISITIYFFLSLCYSGC